MPIFQYYCDDCGCSFEHIVINGWNRFVEPTVCTACGSSGIQKLIGNPSFRLDGKKGLQTVPDPSPPLQKLKEEGPRPGCTGGYADLPEFKPTERTRGKDGNYVWHERKKKYFI